jgi:hypothetical protein
MKDALKQFIPEIGWTKFAPADYELVLKNLQAFGTHGAAAAEYIHKRSVGFGYFPQASSGAGWTLMGNLTLPPNSDLADKRVLAVIIHEVLHLQQPLTTRLSIQGEVLGWQLEYKAYHEVTGKFYGERGLPFEGTHAQWAEISKLSAESYEDLARAQRLMKEVSPVYRAEKLPLYPLGRELRHKFVQRFQSSPAKRPNTDQG